MVANGNSGLTPAMKQYWEVKNKYPDCIILFRMGDFYETFYDDAKVVAHDLQIVLTARGKGEGKAPLAGIPYHALDSYLKKLIDKGHKVVIVEQLEDPKLAKGLVKRGVVRIITPGTLLEPQLIDERANNYLMSVFAGNGRIGLCACDVSTGEIFATEIGEEEAETEFEKFRPKEVLAPGEITAGYEWLDFLKNIFAFKKTELEPYKFDENNGEYILGKMGGALSFSSYGLDEYPLAKRALAGLLSYLKYTIANSTTPKINKISYYNTSKNMIIDATTIRNLDLLLNQADGSERGTLISVIDRTVTPMGGRLLKKWVCTPLYNVKKINERLDNIEQLMHSQLQVERVRDIISGISDIERIATRISYRSVQPRELLVLKQSLERFAELKRLVDEYKLSGAFFGEIAIADALNNVRDIIGKGIDENAKVLVREGGVIKDGYSDELDKLRAVINNLQTWLEKFEQEEKERTGIKTLKVRYNKIIGYYIEVPKSQESKVPADYVRKQTQVMSERYISPKLKETEVMVLNADEKIKGLEQELYDKIVEFLSAHTAQMYTIASLVAELDAYQGFAKVAYENNYTRPTLIESGALLIKDGRHPVVEKNVVEFVPNTVVLDNNNLVMIITGPNMAGKSTIMRQVALIVIMAQMGSYVPASKAEIPLIDRVFTRVGARDDITRGQSTFMNEMVESANILNNATERSLVILDEIGRGTSTYDGMAIAWAIIEHIAEKIRCKTLFATHYHLMNMLSLKYPFVNNYNVAVNEESDRVIFLHKLVEGGTDRSYGVHVAKLAGLPHGVIERARMISKSLEENDFLHRETLNRLTRGGKGIKEDKQTSIGSWTV